MAKWRAGDEETENYTYAIALKMALEKPASHVLSGPPRQAWKASLSIEARKLDNVDFFAAHGCRRRGKYMALVNRATQVHQQLGKFFQTLREGTAPEKFNQQYLKDIGFSSSNYRVLIPLLKDLGFLTSEGAPTERYREYLDASRSRQVLGEAVYDAYSDIFTITKNPTKVDRAKIAGKFKSSFNLSDLQAERNANTFLALAELSDFNQSENVEKSSVQVAQKLEIPSAPLPETNGGRVIGLKYDIAIHLPATKDIEVYNAIFKSLREHLVD